MARTHDRIRRSFVEAASARGRSHGLVGVRVVGPVCVSSESASESRSFLGDARRASARVGVPHTPG